MIADVYVIKRFPRRVGVFTYRVPEGMTVGLGDFVSVPFRMRELVGIVREVREEPSEARLKPLTRVLPYPTLTKADIERYERLAHDLVQSVGSLLFAAFPAFPKRPLSYPATYTPKPLRVPKEDASLITGYAQHFLKYPRAFISVPEPLLALATLSAVQSRLSEPKLLLVPTVRNATMALEVLGGHLVTGEETPIERVRAWVAWRKNGGWLIGTHTAALLPRANASVFVLRSGHESLVRGDRNPRFSVRQTFGDTEPRIVCFDAAPGIEDLVRENPSAVRFPEAVSEQVRFTDLAVGRSVIHPLVPDTTYEAIEEALRSGGRIVCLLDRKGSSRVFFCRACGWKSPQDSVPEVCGSCRSTDLKSVRGGMTAVTDALQSAFPEIPISLYDRDREVPPKTARLIVTTRAFFETRTESFGTWNLVVLLDADVSLRAARERSSSETLRTLFEWLGLARKNRCPLIIQTRQPELFRRFLSEPASVLKEDADAAQSYHLPPFGKRFAVTTKGDDLSELLRLAGEAGYPPDHGEIDRLIWMSPTPETTERLLTFFSTLEDRYIIDTNAFF